MSADPGALVGRVLGGRYVLDRHLGRGAMGDVYRAHHVKVPRAFAVKILRPELVKDPKVVSRFEREAQLAGRLQHRNVTSVIDVGVADGTHYLVMDFADGSDLGTVMAGEPMESTRAIALFGQIVDGLAHAHAHEVVHRDLKPENVIVERSHGEEIVRIVDFGVAILRDGASTSHGRLTTGGLVVGTPHYMAPELATGQAFDHRIDLFALGVILFELLTGVMPFSGSGVEVAMANIQDATPTMALRAPGVRVDPLLEALTRKLMEKQADRRPQTARDVRHLIDLIARDRDAAAQALGVAPVARAPRPLVAAASLESPASARLPLGAAATVSPRLESPAVLVEPHANKPRRLPPTTRASALALVLVVCGLGVALLDHAPPSPPIALELGAEVPLAALRERSTTQDTVPARTRSPLPAPVITPRSRPAPVMDVTTPAPPVAARELAPADVGSVVALYQALARDLKTIADRRDLSADDLWQRYRRIRIQEALATSAKRAAVMNELALIDRQLGQRFGTRLRAR
ncbi:MAG: protein kinase [Myxococcales bacterium]|nr:protein kinase [Myxococcales bacterium]